MWPVTAFLDAGATVKQTQPGVAVVDHAKFRAVIVQGKALTAAQEATKRLINEYKARWMVMVGIAGSLGDEHSKEEGPRHPRLGDVVVATSLAPYEIRDKVRSGEVQNVPVPFQGLEWGVLPTHPWLFALAVKAAQRFQDRTFRVVEGLIVTGTGIKDDRVAREEILREYPGALAAEEEGYIFGLLCLIHGRPYIVLRGISDFVGHKVEQQRVNGDEDEAQRRAARNAARMAVNVIDVLSDRWGTPWVVE